MKNLYQYIFTFCISVCMYSCASYGPKATDNTLAVILSDTQQAVTSLGEKISVTEDDTLITAYKSLEEKSKELFPALKKCNEKYRLTKNYIATLEGAQKTLQQLDTEFNTMPDKAFIIEAVYLDYDAKLQSINSSAKSDANTTIRVTVDSSEDEGFFVFGKLSYEQKLDIKRFRFNKPTQNAFLDFVPGYYLFWLEKEDRVGEPELHLIVSNGVEEEKKLVLKTPK